MYVVGWVCVVGAVVILYYRVAVSSVKKYETECFLGIVQKTQVGFGYAIFVFGRRMVFGIVMGMYFSESEVRSSSDGFVVFGSFM